MGFTGLTDDTNQELLEITDDTDVYGDYYPDLTRPEFIGIYGLSGIMLF